LAKNSGELTDKCPYCSTKGIWPGEISDVSYR